MQTREETGSTSQAREKGDRTELRLMPKGGARRRSPLWRGGPAGRMVSSKAKGSSWKGPGLSRYLRWSEMLGHLQPIVTSRVVEHGRRRGTAGNIALAPLHPSHQLSW